MKGNIDMKHILDGKIVAEKLKEQLKDKISKLPRKLNLMIISHNDKASQSYLKGRKKLAEYLNVNIVESYIGDKNTQQVIDLIKKANRSSKIDGIMVDRPLLPHLDEELVLSSISPNKDIDGYHSENLGKLLKNEKSFHSCTPSSAIEILKYYKYNLTGKNAVVIGRSINVGKPLSLMLLNENASVTILHSKSKNIAKITKKADVIFLAVGKKDYLTLDMVNKKSVIIDIGINFDENNKLCGDASRSIYDKVRAYTPVPGGVGVVTNVMLMENLYKAYKLKEK